MSTTKMSSIIYATGSNKVEGKGERTPQPSSKTKIIHRCWKIHRYWNPDNTCHSQYHSSRSSHKSQGNTLWITILPELMFLHRRSKATILKTSQERMWKVQKALPGAGCRSFHSVEIKISITFMRCSVFSELQKKRVFLETFSFFWNNKLTCIYTHSSPCVWYKGAHVSVSKYLQSKLNDPQLRTTPNTQKYMLLSFHLTWLLGIWKAEDWKVQRVLLHSEDSCWRLERAWRNVLANTEA